MIKIEKSIGYISLICKQQKPNIKKIHITCIYFTFAFISITLFHL